MGDYVAAQDANPTNTPNSGDQSTVGMKAEATPPPPEGMSPYLSFPYANSRRRIGDYDYYMRLLLGEHFEAFNIRINDEKYTREYSKLRYVMVNFAGLIAKVVADMLFSEPPSFKAPDKDPKKQAFLDALVHENDLHTQNYESAMDNAAIGDALYKVRVGERFDGDNKPTVIIEDITPSIYFPTVNGFNVRAEPREKELAWTFYKGKNKYLRKEIHRTGEIENQVWSMENDRIMTQQPLSLLGEDDLPEVQETLIDRSLLIHVPNWKTGNRYFGISDYADLDKLFYAINNRFTKVDNILDKHGDPILSVPSGVLDENGKVKKKALGVIEMGEGETGKPEYIVWDAKLEAAYSQIEKLIDVMLMTAEISPDVLGMGKGMSDSGRALRLKILRTIAKVARKKLYYDRRLKETLHVAMLIAKAHKVKVGDLDPVEPFIPDIEWADGLPMDMTEQVDIEGKRLDQGTTTAEDSIMRLDSVDEDTAKKKAAEIKKANEVEMQSMFGAKPFGPNAGANKGGTPSPGGAGNGNQK
jgi:hypothetical protein